MAYQQNIPTGLVNLDEDYLNLQGNFQSLDSTFGVDHLPFSNTTPNLGFHTQVRYNANQASPTLSTAVGMIYANTDWSTRSFPFWRNAGGITQVMGACSVTSTNFAAGYVTLAGGLIIIWGTSTPGASGVSTPVVFSPSFPNNIFSVQLTLQHPTGSNASSAVLDNAIPPTRLGFSYYCNLGANNKLYWIAIGN